MKKSGKYFVIGIVLYVITTGVSYAFFSSSSSAQSFINTPAAQPKKGIGGKLVFDKSLPKTEPCPLNGALYSKQQKEWWEKHRPLGVMVENHVEARPQSGLSFADVVYEIVAEGGITRFLGVYMCQDSGIIGPVRSARTYFIDFMSEYGNSPLYAHVGGANTPGPADALGQLTDYGWTSYNDLNQFSIGFPTFKRDYDRMGRTVATEHTMYSETSKLWDFAAKDRDLTNKDKEGTSWDEKFIEYSFKDDAVLSARSVAQTIHIEFWEGYDDFFVDWTYDKASNLYKRNNGGAPHLEKNTNKQLTAKNIVVLYMQESNANDGYENNLHLLYKTKGTGKALVFMDGKETKATWKKDSRTGRTLLTDSNGKEIKFNRGTIWFTIVPTAGVVTVK